MLEKVQYRLFQRLRQLLARHTTVNLLPIVGAEELWEACDAARQAHEEGQPLIPIREIIAYLIVKKLHKQDMWGGDAKYKDFLWGHLLPKGGFPKDLVGRGDVMDVAVELEKQGVLKAKVSQGQPKYALRDRSTVERILSERSFEFLPGLRRFFDRSKRLATVRLLDYNDS